MGLTKPPPASRMRVTSSIRNPHTRRHKKREALPPYEIVWKEIHGQRVAVKVFPTVEGSAPAPEYPPGRFPPQHVGHKTGHEGRSKSPE